MNKGEKIIKMTEEIDDIFHKYGFVVNHDDIRRFINLILDYTPLKIIGDLLNG